MKRFFCLCLILMVLTVQVCGAEFGTILDLWNHWSETETPDWICGVSSTDGSMERLTVIVKTAEDEQRLRDLLENEETLTVYVSETSYTRAELEQVHEEIVSRHMGSGSPVVGVGIGWTTINGEVSGFGPSGKESRVIVSVLEAHAAEYASLFAEQYGDLVYVESTSGYDIPAMEEAAAGAPEPEKSPLGIAAAVTAVLLLAAGICLVVLWKRKMPNSEKCS